MYNVTPHEEVSSTRSITIGNVESRFTEEICSREG